MSYKLFPVHPQSGKSPDCVQRLSDGACVPFDKDNTDYQIYLKWLSQGNQPLPPDQNGG